MAAAGQADADTLVSVMAPWANGRQYLNFAEHAVDASTGYDAESYARLQAVRAAVDPHGTFVSNHKVPSSTITLPTQR